MKIAVAAVCLALSFNTYAETSYVQNQQMNSQLVKLVSGEQDTSANKRFLKKYEYSQFFDEDTAYSKIYISSDYMDEYNEETQYSDVLLAVDGEDSSITAVSVIDPKPFRDIGWRCDAIQYLQESYICQISEDGDLSTGELLLVSATLKYSSQLP